MSIEFRRIKNETITKITDSIRNVLGNSNKVDIDNIPNIIKEYHNARIKHIIEAEYFENSTTELILNEKQLKGVTKIGDYALSGWHWLRTLIIPDTVTDIGSHACSKASNLTTVQIGNGVENIGVGAFSECRNLKGVTAANKVKTIGDYAFSGCENLETIRLSTDSTVESIGECAFENCIKLSSALILSEKLKTIPRRAFYNCKSLEFASGITARAAEIGNFAFAGCESLVDECSNSVETIGVGAFKGCTGLTDACYDAANILGESSFEDCTALKRVTLGAISHIPNDAFKNCTNLMSFSIKNTEQMTIGDGAFQNCTGFCPYMFLEVYNVTSIGKYSFSNIGATQLQLSTGMLSIPVGAFSGCLKLNSVMVENSNLREIWDEAFLDCPNLYGITFRNPSCIPSLLCPPDRIFPPDCHFWVPYSMYDEWKTQSGWSEIADRIRVDPSTRPTEG